MDDILWLDPKDRITAEAALDSEWFYEKPLPLKLGECVLSDSLLGRAKSHVRTIKFKDSHEFDRVKRQQARQVPAGRLPGFGQPGPAKPPHLTASAQQSRPGSGMHTGPPAQPPPSKLPIQGKQPRGQRASFNQFKTATASNAPSQHNTPR
jgi:hypothetical protein